MAKSLGSDESKGDARLLADLAALDRLTSEPPSNAHDRLETELGVEQARALVVTLTRRVTATRVRVS